MRKNILLVITSLLFFVQTKTIAQCNNWQQGDFETYSQNSWGDGSTAAGTLLQANFISTYPNDLVVGSTYTLSLTSAAAIFTLLPSVSSSGVLVANIQDPQTTPAGELAGEVVALQLNVDMSDAGLLGGSYPFGDLVIHDFTTLPVINGKTVRQFLAMANNILGGGAGEPFGSSTAALVASILNEAFLTGTPSQFAQEHLRKGWQAGDFETYSQGGWDQGSGATLLAGNFSSVFGGGLTIGSLYTTTFTNASGVFAYLPALGSPATFSGNLTNPITTSAGELGGQVLALQLNVDLNDAGLLTGSQSTRFGDLVIHDFTPIQEVNGWTVRQFLATANTVVGGLTDVITPSQTLTVANLLNTAFANGTPSQFAQLHLKKGWQQGDFETYSQNSFGDAFSEGGNQLGLHFSGVYGGSGLTIGGTNTLQFTNGTAVVTFLPATGPAGSLTGSLTDPITSSAGELAGQLLALQLNVDFSEAGFITSLPNVGFGDLVIDNLPIATAANGMTVREFLNAINIQLGGGGAPFSASQAATVASLLNGAFIDGTPNSFAQGYLFAPCEPLCPKLKDAGIVTYSQTNWGDASSSAGILLSANFDSEYPNDLRVGSIYLLTLTSDNAVFVLLPALSSAAILTINTIDPQVTNAGELAGEVVALKLNVDFSDSNILPGTLKFGDLVFHDYTSIPAINGLTVREFLDMANEVLGGNQSGSLGASTIATVARLLNSSFINGNLGQFALTVLSIPCESNHCPVATAASITTKLGTAINIQLQASDEDNDELSYSISQDPAHGIVTTSASGAAVYTPTAGYYGADEFKFNAGDGECDDEETVTITIVKCPAGKGNWMNNPDSWPEKATPMLLGTQSYTKEQLLVILNTPVGTGQKADASLILAHQLIPAKLNEADGADTPDDVKDAIEAADLLIGNNVIPMRVKPNTPLGQQMVNSATLLENYNKALLTQACQTTVPVTSTKQQNSLQEISQSFADALEARLYPNPSGSYFNIVINSKDSKERIVLQVFDQYGRTVDVRSNISNGSTVRIGDLYQPGVYYVRVLQGKQHKEIKLIKLSD